MKKRSTLLALTSAIILLVPGTGACSFREPLEEFSIPENSTNSRPEDKTPSWFRTKATGYLVYDFDKHQVLLAHNIHKAFIPASVTKLATAIAALKTLGRDYRFGTRLMQSGEIRDGTLHGNLCLKGFGDPTFTIPDLLDFVEELREAGIHSVKGDFLYDVTWLTNQTIIDPDLGKHDSYNPGIAALSLNYNLITAHWKRSKRHLKGVGYFSPNLPYLQLLLPRRHHHGYYALKQINSTSTGKVKWQLKKAPRLNGRRALPIRYPGRYAAETLRKLCAVRNITLPPAKSGRADDSYSVIHEHRSAPLSRITELMLDYSNNLIAEALLLTSGRHALKRKSTIREAAGYLARDFFPARLPRMNWDTFHLENGSGLTSKNRITPAQAIGLLVMASRMQIRERSFFRLLPLSGAKGSLRNRLDSPGTAYRLQAKTGSIFYARALAGRVFTSSGRSCLFAIFVSSFNNRDILDKKKKDKTYKRTLSRAGNWSRTQGRAIRSVIRTWINTL